MYTHIEYSNLSESEVIWFNMLKKTTVNRIDGVHDYYQMLCDMMQNDVVQTSNHLSSDTFIIFT